jgi:hypothetical protein
MAAEDREVGSTQGECTNCGTTASSESSFDELAKELAPRHHLARQGAAHDRGAVNTAKPASIETGEPQ